MLHVQDEVSAGKREVHCLVVGDNPDFRKRLVQMLISPETAVVELNDPERAIQMIENGAEFDLVITDFNMPGRTGLEVLQSLRQWLPMSLGILVAAEWSHSHLKSKVETLGGVLISKSINKSELWPYVLAVLAVKKW